MEKVEKKDKTNHKPNYHSTFKNESLIINTSDIVTPTITETNTTRNRKISIHSMHKENLLKINKQMELLQKNKEKLKEDTKMIPEFLKYLDTKNASKLQQIKNISTFDDDKNLNSKTGEKQSMPEDENSLRIINEKKSYNGPIDISCCLVIEPFNLSCKVVNTLKKMRIIYVQKNILNWRCHKEGLHFGIEIFPMKEIGISYLKLKRLQGTFSEYNQTISKLLLDVK